ncbi:MAG TPA: hypothetical protein VJ242_02840 [Patescibacteria group bacterium]|nr:hypothetical protein [Patescibacteria group bacterium]
MGLIESAKKLAASYVVGRRIGSYRRKADKMVQTAKIVDEASFGEINQLLLGVYDLLALDKFNGSINLGAKKRQVNWAQMPLEIAAIFLPEFDHRPEEISDFKISQLETTNPRFRGLSLTLFRNSEWTSRLDLVVTDTGGSVNHYFEFMGIKNRLPEAMEAARKLDDSLWMRKISDGEETIESTAGKSFLHSQNSLELTKRFLLFTEATKEAF